MHPALLRLSTALRAAMHRHRVMVVLPMMVAVTALSMQAGGGGAATMRGEVIGESPVTEGRTLEGWVVALASGARAMLNQGAAFSSSATGALLREGTALVGGAGMVEILAGPFRLLGWSGGFSVSVGGSNVTVAALTTPVLVAGSSGRLLLPARFQWQGAVIPDPLEAVRAMKPLPPAYIDAQVLRLQSLAATEESDRTNPVQHSLFPLKDMVSFLRLPKARQRAAEERDQKTFAAFAAHLQAGERMHVLSMLQKGVLAGALASASVDSQMLALLPQASRQGFAQWFLPPFLAAEDRWLLGSLHSDLRSHTWSLPAPASAGRDGRLLRVVMLPQSDVLPEGSDALVIRRWGEEIAALLKDAQRPADLAGALLPVLAASIERFGQKGYPLRAQRYASALFDAAMPWVQDMPGPARDALQRVQLLKHPAPPGISLSSPQPPTPNGPAAAEGTTEEFAERAPLLKSAEVHDRAIEALRSMSALFTVRTAVTPVNGTNAARVQDIGFATPQGDQLFTFIYDVTTDTVSDIERQGQALPYTVTLAQFVEWVARR